MRQRHHGGAGIWQRRLAPCVAEPGRWFVVYQDDDGRRATIRIIHLRAGTVKLPRGTVADDFEFFNNQGRLFACYTPRASIVDEAAA